MKTMDQQIHTSFDLDRDRFVIIRAINRLFPDFRGRTMQLLVKKFIFVMILWTSSMQKEKNFQKTVLYVDRKLNVRDCRLRNWQQHSHTTTDPSSHKQQSAFLDKRSNFWSRMWPFTWHEPTEKYRVSKSNHLVREHIILFIPFRF